MRRSGRRQEMIYLSTSSEAEEQSLGGVRKGDVARLDLVERSLATGLDDEPRTRS
jgi:hypothetical protein